MGAAARESGVVLAEAFMYRHHPQTLKVKALVDAGAIGPVRFVRGTFSFPLTRPDDVRLRPEWGGGCLWDVGCYPLSFTRFLLGARAARGDGRAACSARPGSTRRSPASWCSRAGSSRRSTPASARPCGAENRGRRHRRHDPRAAALAAGSRLPILVTRGERTEAIAVAETDRYLLEIEDLAECVRTGREPRVALAESRGNVATIVALLQSAREGRPVRL